MFGLGNIVGGLAGAVSGLVGGLAKTGVGAVTTLVSSTLGGAKNGATGGALPQLLGGASTTLTPLGAALGPASASTTSITSSNGDTETDSHIRTVVVAVFGLLTFLLPLPGFLKGMIAGPGVAYAMMLEHKLTHHPHAAAPPVAAAETAPQAAPMAG
jgi:hypothetical protein